MNVSDKNPGVRCLEAGCSFHCMKGVQLRDHLHKFHDVKLNDESLSFSKFSGLLYIDTIVRCR